MLVSLIRRLGVKLSLNDPRWGHKPEGDNKKQEGKKPGGEGPPDLDQMWRDFNQRLNRMFGQKNNGGGGGGDYRPDMKGAGITAGVVGAIAVFIWLASGAFIVQEGSVGVVTTFGRLSHTTGAGFNWRWPYPFQAHETVNVSTVRTAEVGYRGSVRSKNTKESLMLTDDENIIDIQFAVQYTLKDPVAWIYTNREHDDDTVRQIAETAIREVVGKSKMDFVLYEGREKVALDATRLMQDLANRYNLGAQITNVTMQSVQPPEQVQGAFDDAVKAGQDRARARSEGEAYANNVIPSSRGDAIRLTQEAEAYRAKVTENATGNAARFSQVLTEYQKAPGVTRDRMYLDTMQEIFTSASKVMVDAKAGSNLLYLPLDKLIAQSAGKDGGPGSKSGPVQPMPAAAPQPQETMQTAEQVRQRDSRGRDNSRDRETR
ncbi:FtsH protease activity modulator HflK [Massilia sp. R2A-15]|uniref:FtsH protease activity modulator HflK n=1 Tax=Massilia sp. R2A-15 TaxID=3064278 RepID=UPI002736A16F|nr:FtsH protease activity modulator HflK [Massilia sp. R2A-15]WLI87592.1 FtsH protease activity modulator HflK [Massilia sp. R2A-15]